MRHIGDQTAVQSSAQENPPHSVVLHPLLSCLNHELFYYPPGLLIGLEFRGFDSLAGISPEAEFPGVDIPRREFPDIIGNTHHGLCL
ncbi:MAG: hypothetical protein DDT24_00908 [Chloroflexi bacterium]|nr:hypothetical protein [Chloroflexota bacterium]